MSAKLYTARVLPTIPASLEGLALMVSKSRMVLAAPGPLLAQEDGQVPSECRKERGEEGGEKEAAEEGGGEDEAGKGKQTRKRPRLSPPARAGGK